YMGGMVGMFAMIKATVHMAFTSAGIAAGEGDHIENWSTSNQLFYEGHGGIEYAFMDRLTIGAECGYFYGKLSGWTAANAYTAFGRAVAPGDDVTDPGAAAPKSERLGGVFGRVVLRSYF